MVPKGRRILQRTGCRAAALALLVGWLAGCEPEAPAPEVIRPVRYQVVGAAGSDQRRYSGTTQAELEIDLSFRVGGRLNARPVNIGEVVEPNELIAELDPADYEVRVQEASAGRDLARAAVTNAAAERDRVSRLYENGSVSRREWDAATAAFDSAQAQLDAALQQLQVAQNQLAYTQLRAPQMCTVAQTFVEINQNVAAGQAIVKLNCGQCSEVAVSVPEVDIGTISEGDEVSVRISALGDRRLSGFVREVGVDTGASGTTFPVVIGLRDRCEEVRAGMAADVDIVRQSTGPEGSLIVPFVSVGEDRDTGDNFVFVLEPTGEGGWTATRRTVTIGDPTGNGLIVTSGLEAGDRVVTAGVTRLRQNQEVRLLD